MTYRSTATRWSPWDYRETSWSQMDLTDYQIEAADGEIGKVDQATQEAGGSYLIVDTGPWIFGKKVMLPAGVVSRIDHENQRVFVDRTKEQIENAPEFDESMLDDIGYRDRVGGYYSEWYDREAGL
ncbi:MAG: PRC-barrel domain containing protein [Chloroflexota bacterium]|nr:PRC-barrel domain containing protein [Chloroflexota bacterium]